jgi:hypothetical protein
LVRNDEGGGDGEQNADKSKDTEQSHPAAYNAMHQRTLYYRIVLEIDSLSSLAGNILVLWWVKIGRCCSWFDYSLELK